MFSSIRMTMLRLALSKVTVRVSLGAARAHQTRILLGDQPGHLALEPAHREREPDPLGQVGRHRVEPLEERADPVQDLKVEIVHRLVLRIVR